MNKGFLKNVVTLLYGSGVSQIISVISIPILTYFYSPTEFGEYATLLALITIISVLASGRYELAIMLPKSNEESAYLFYITQFFNITVFVLVNIILLITYKYGYNILSSNVSGITIFIFSIAIFSLSANQSLIYLANKFDKFNSISISRILNSLFVTIFSILFYRFGSLGMLIAFCFGNILSSINILWRTRHYLVRVNISRMIISLKEYKDFPQKNLLSGLLNIASSQIPILLITLLFGPTISGYYSMSMRIINAPMSFLGKAFSQVYFNKMSKIDNRKKLKVFQKTTFLLAGIIVPLMAGLFLLSDLLFLKIFGEDWFYSSTITKILIPFFIIRFIFSCQSSILIIERSLSFELYFNIINFILQVTAVCIPFYLNWGEDYIFILMSFLGTSSYLFLGYYMYKKLKGNYDEKNIQSYIG